MSTSPDDVFIHPAWRRAREECLAALIDAGRAILCGVPGTGKSMLLQELQATLRAQGRSVVLVQYGDPVAETTAAEILLVDEADRLSGAQIRHLRQRPGALLLAGLPRLREHVVEAAEPRPFDVIKLDPLSQDDVAHLVSIRLAAVGHPSNTFAPAATAALARHSGGLFRVVIILAGAALFFAELRGADAVTPSDIAEAASMRDTIADEAAEDMPMIERPPPRAFDAARWSRRAVMAVVGLIAMTGVAVHLAATSGGSAAAPIDAGRTAANRVASVSAAQPLAPKHKLARPRL